MKSLVFAVVVLTFLVMPSSAVFEKMFDLGNFTVDTGLYLPATNAAV